MKTLKTTFTHYEITILNSIDFDGYGINPLTEFDKVQELNKIFVSEFCFPQNVARYGTKKNLFAEWLRGLPIVCSVPFYNYEILENAKNNGFELMTEQAEDNFLSMYWVNLASAFYTLKENL